MLSNLTNNWTRRCARVAAVLGLTAAASGGCGGEGGLMSAGGADGSYFNDPDGDQYDAVGTNPFVDPEHDPFSTFGADVDTASYDIFVRDVGSGWLPSPSSVRLEEYVNFFDYAYATPAHDAATPFTITLNAAAHVMGRDTSMLRVGIQAKSPPPEEKRPANLVFLIDVSGSMQGAQKLPLVKQVLIETLDVLDDTDTVSIVTYASGTGVALPPTPVSRSGEILWKIQSLSAGGSTDGAGGIQLAYDQAAAAYVDGGINHVLLLTDGDFNVGISDTDSLVRLIEDKRRTGITLTVLGFGSGNLNDGMMEKVSNAGNGVYGVITSAQHAIDYVRERMLSTLVHIAKDMKIQVEFNADHVTAYRLLGYENRAIADDDFRNDAVDAGEVGAGHRVTALYEVVLRGQSLPTPVGAPEVDGGPAYVGETEILPSEVVKVKIRYKDVDASEADAAYEVSQALDAGQFEQAMTAADPDMQWASAIAAFAEILKDSPYADPENLERIATIVEEQRTRDDDRAAFARLFATARTLLSR